MRDRSKLLPKDSVIDRIMDVIMDKSAKIETGAILARVTVEDTRIVVEWGEAMKTTELIFRNTKKAAGSPL